ncbi:MAG: hypothetical protein KBC27_03975, partial [Rickettsiales bacterium]|nr:hypothetical protein [Rickettsiales bacterium]
MINSYLKQQVLNNFKTKEEKEQALLILGSVNELHADAFIHLQVAERTLANLREISEKRFTGPQTDAFSYLQGAERTLANLREISEKRFTGPQTDAFSYLQGAERTLANLREIS